MERFGYVLRCASLKRSNAHMAVHLQVADDDVGHRTPNRPARDISHRFRHQRSRSMGWGIRLALGIVVSVLLAFTFGPSRGARHRLAHRTAPDAAASTPGQVLSPSDQAVAPPGSGFVFRVQVA